MKEENLKYLYRWQAECSRRELCEAQIRRKLAGYGGGGTGLLAEEADEIIERLKKDKFLDDNRFAVAYIKDKTTFSGWGIRKIETELLKRGVAKSVIDNAVAVYIKEEQGEEKQQQTLEKLAAQKWSNIVKEAERKGEPNMQTERLKAKLIRFLIGRGYSFEMAYSQSAKMCLHNDMPNE